ncbi:MAG: tesA [Rhodospirillales bacterium]|jgi:acyl-CoA thioesterase-1|nr:tesA [Rhodospirillales bacterium]
MKSIFVFLAAVLAPLSAAPALADPIQIVAFGGSSTYGALEARDRTYPFQLEQALRAKGHDVVVTNAGINGSRTTDGLARLDATIPDGTHIVLLEYGINDSFAKLPRSQTMANIETMVNKLRARGIQVFVLGYRGSSGLDALATKYNAAFMQFGFLGNENPSYRIQNDPQQQSQGVAHFNGAGYAKIVERMLPYVETLISRVRT